MTWHLQPMDAGIIRAFKAIYKQLRILWILQLDKAGEEDIFNLSQLDAMHMVAEAWSQITKVTIHNCWWHTGILGAFADKTDIPIDLALLADKDEVKKVVDELDEVLAKLSINHIGKKQVMSVAEWLDTPGEDVTEGKWTDKDIVEQVEINKCEAKDKYIAELDVDSEHAAAGDEAVSWDEVVAALKKLNQYLIENPSQQSHWHQALNQLLKAQIKRDETEQMLQSRLHSYFKPSDEW